MSLSRISFRDFLLNENKYYLGQRIGDVLTAIQDLQQNGESMGRRQMTANAQRIVDQIRTILHSNWSKKEEKYLTAIQKAGVAIARSIDEKDDLEEILGSVGEELQQVVSKMGVPVNSLATPPEEEPGEGDSQVADSQGEKPQQPKQQPEQPPQQPDPSQQQPGMPPQPGAEMQPPPQPQQQQQPMPQM
jgi:hypothetical protein